MSDERAYGTLRIKMSIMGSDDRRTRSENRMDLSI